MTSLPDEILQFSLVWCVCVYTTVVLLIYIDTTVCGGTTDAGGYLNSIKHRLASVNYSLCFKNFYDQVSFEPGHNLSELLDSFLNNL